MLLFFGWEIGHPLSRYDIEKLKVPGRSSLKPQYKDFVEEIKEKSVTFAKG